ncbi:MAG: InlB B-repeat-containing protein, partial [Clostridia bacterium]|nr:InlB B-repeat-containing protein [Clostridia bacterium]
MTKKKITLCTTAIIALMAGTLVTPSLVKTDKAAAASETVKTIFSDDFSTYDSYDQMGLNWSNYYFDQADAIAQFGEGTERIGWASNKWASVAQDPDDPTNKVLDIDTEETFGVGAGGNSYFYITPSKDGEPLLLKNYTISFRYKVKNTCAGANTVTAPWIATLNRKKNVDANGDYQPYDGAFIDTTNSFMSSRAGTRAQDASGTAPYYFSEALLWDIGYNPMPVGTATNTVATNDIYGDWITYKCVVFENTFTLYLNDTLMTQFTVPTYDSQAKNLDAGYVSIACCVLDAYLDDITITTTPDHPEVSGQTEIAREQGVAMPVVYDLETYGEAITQVDVRRKGEKTVALNSDAYTYENGLFRLDANYVSLLPKGKTEFVIHTAKGSVNVVVNVTDANVLQSTPISLTATKGVDKSVALTGATAVYGISRGDKAVLSGEAWSFADGTLTLTKDYINYLFSDNDLPLLVYTDAGYYTVQLTIVDAKTITVEKNIAAAGSVTGDGVYEDGATVTLTAQTNTGYEFLGWWEGSSQVSSDVTYSFTSTANKTIEAKWKINTYTITVNKNIAEAGMVGGGGVYEHGTSVTLTANTNAGYTFEGWYDGETQLSTNEGYNFTANADRTITAKWTKNTYNVTVTAGNGGTATGEGVYEHGATVELIATTNTGYRFLGWYDGETLLSANEEYQVTVFADKTYTAKWEEILPPSVPTYTITIERNIVAAGEATDSGTFDEGVTLTLMATTNEGYRFLGWYDGETLLSANEEYQ